MEGCQAAVPYLQRSTHDSVTSARSKEKTPRPPENCGARSDYGLVIEPIAHIQQELGIGFEELSAGVLRWGVPNEVNVLLP
jgi:hypothetical protein